MAKRDLGNTITSITAAVNITTIQASNKSLAISFHLPLFPMPCLKGIMHRQSAQGQHRHDSRNSSPGDKWPSQEGNRPWNKWVRPGSPKENLGRKVRSRTASLTDEEERECRQQVVGTSVTAESTVFHLGMHRSNHLQVSIRNQEDWKKRRMM